MQLGFLRNNPIIIGDKYIKIKYKFIIGQTLSLIWVALSIYLSIPWINDLAKFIGHPLAIIIISGISYIPGYINFFTIISLILDKQPSFNGLNPRDEISIIIACYNEEKSIGTTLSYIIKQNYEGNIKVYVVDNNSTDSTSKVAIESGEKLGLDIKVLFEGKKGKNNALNTALKEIDTEYVITLDADTLLHKSAIKNIVCRIKSSPKDVGAVAGSVLVRNSRQNLLCKLQEWDYFLGIASIKRLQGLYQGTLVAQGAYSIYKTEVVKSVGGWSDCIGEDIVLTWKMLEKGNKVYYEPTAVVFTEVPASLNHFQKQRSRWARGMIEGLKEVNPIKQPIAYVKYLTGINLIMPFIDIVYTFVWIPGLIMACFGMYHIVGFYTVLVLPLAMIQNYLLYKYQKGVFKELNLRIRKNAFGFLVYVLCYQILMSPISVIGYVQELLGRARVWK